MCVGACVCVRESVGAWLHVWNGVCLFVCVGT